MNLFAEITLAIHEWHWLIFFGLPAIFGCLFYVGNASESPKIVLQSVVIPALIAGGSVLFWNVISIKKWPKLPSLEFEILAWSFLIWSGSILSAFLLTRALSAKVDWLKNLTVKRTSLARTGKTDVRKLDEVLPATAKKFNPTDFWHRESVFLGIGVDGKPVRAPYPLRHLQVTGTSGCGKGVLLSQIALEMSARQEAVFFIDPKRDEWAPSVCSQAKNFYLIDLNADKPQFNMFSGASETEIYELFLAGFSLGERGTDADFYRLADRQAAKAAAKTAFSEKLTARQLHQKIGLEIVKDSAGFEGYLREMASSLAVNAESGGVELQKIIADGGLVYVIGSMRNAEVIRMQRMLLVRLIQLAEARDRSAGKPRQICVLLDELKYHLSRPALEALGAARDKGMHVVLAYQSLADLRDCPADLDGDVVVGAIFENTPIKVTYRIEDTKIAEMLAEKSGKVQVDDEVRMVSVGAGRVEKLDSKRTIRQTETHLIDQNMFLNLRQGQAVVFGAAQLPQFITTSPITVEKKRIEPVQGSINKKSDGAADDIFSIDPLPKGGI